MCLLRGTDWVFKYNLGESEPSKCQRPQLYTRSVWRHRQLKTAHSCYYNSPRTDCQSSGNATRLSHDMQHSRQSLSLSFLTNCSTIEVSKYFVRSFSAWKNVVKTDTYIYIYIYIYIALSEIFSRHITPAGYAPSVSEVVTFNRA